MKKWIACMLTICLLAACAAPGLAAGSHPTFTDQVLYKNFLGELAQLDIQVDPEAPFRMGNKDPVTYAASPAKNIYFGILYADGAVMNYTLYVPFIDGDDEQSPFILYAFARTFFDNNAEDAKKTLRALMAGGKEGENGEVFNQMEIGGAFYQYILGKDFVSLSYIFNQ